ncbi:MAG: DUF177 domain-containing protein [Peptococcaceae bacterium]|jgi:uncharacterized protein|nr:DUF177 domain-containing protein [Peptococcaceae bacterium]
MKINIAEIRRMEGSTLHYDLREQFPAVEFDGEQIVFVAPIHVQIAVTNAEKELWARGTIQSEMRVACSRCLEEFRQPLAIPYEDEWIAVGQATEEQAETALLFEKDEIEIQDRVMEQILLSLPMKTLCSADCRGLCPSCGQNLNLGQCQCREDTIDPRLAELAKWNHD